MMSSKRVEKKEDALETRCGKSGASSASESHLTSFTLLSLSSLVTASALTQRFESLHDTGRPVCTSKGA